MKSHLNKSFILLSILFSISLLHAKFAKSQSTPFNIIIEPISISGMPGLQSFAYAQHNGKWLLVGGRTDGLHRRQPFASFDTAGNNHELFVVDPLANQVWTSSLNALPSDIQEQLSSTNMQFHQEGNYLYVCGGYGYDANTNSKITFNHLTAIDVPATINSIIGGTSVINHFRQISDPKFAVTGGHLKKIYGTYYLVGGQKFDGNYNPMGNPTYTQTYTNAIRKFDLQDNGATITVSHYPEIFDSIALHRRDYNVTSQIMPNGKEGLTAFSGVFQTIADIPYLNSVNIDSSGYSVNNSFSQYYNHYHCANIPMYDSIANEMHTIFFGGIAQYYDNAGVLTQDNNVPFVKTIARVTRDASGAMAEYKLPIEMPSFLGASSECIKIEGLPTYENEVIKLNMLVDDTTLVAYIVGGINSTAANIFTTNTGSQSSAVSTLYKVYLIKNKINGLHTLNNQSKNSLHMQVFPNPNDGIFRMTYYLKNKTDVQLSITDLQGHKLYQQTMRNQSSGENLKTLQLQNLKQGAVIMVSITTEDESATQKIYIH
ncbi:MAG: T9SS type A sorting domain-containing protein [Bacteroidetes bacterium]|nr:T9SS type A sorting domain-containing protein [Bacteroidota bacterium]